ncbi:transcription factor IIA subunit alpha [Podochytrium sp. JEL0797]|nr:transcription factor IIA subunit alpha [Podochytrium sp. JEL0797]
MSNQAVPGVYTWIIDDVVTKTRPYFQSMGLSDQALTEIEKKWMEKLVASRCGPFANAPPPQQPQQQINTNIPQYPNPNINNIPPANSMPQMQQQMYNFNPQSQPSQQPQQQYYDNTDFLNNPYAMQQHTQNPMMLNYGAPGGAPLMQLPPLQQQQQQQQQQNQYRPNLGGYQLHQNDGAIDSDPIPLPPTSPSEPTPTPATARAEIDALLESAFANTQRRNQRVKEMNATRLDGEQVEGDLMDGNAGVEVTDRDEKRRVLDRVFGGGKKGKMVAQNDGNDDEEDDDDDEEDDTNRLGSDLDSGDDDDDDDPDLNDLILCQYEKVNRTKNKWKCVFKDGIIHVNGKDYLFHKATSDFEW